MCINKKKEITVLIYSVQYSKEPVNRDPRIAPER